MIKKDLIIGRSNADLLIAIALRRAWVNVNIVEINRGWQVYHGEIIMPGNFIRAS